MLNLTIIFQQLHLKASSSSIKISGAWQILKKSIGCSKWTMNNEIALRTSKGEYLPGETVYG